jgi:transposase
LPEKHPARFVVEIVEQLDLQPLNASYCGRGSKPYNPEMLVALLFYDERFCRKGPENRLFSKTGFSG